MGTEVEKVIAAIFENSDNAAEVVREFRDYLNDRSINDVTPLLAASSKGHLAMVELLVRLGANPNLPGYLGATALHEAATKGFLDIVRHLLLVGSNINARADGGVTPLMCAAAWGRADVVLVLLEQGADPMLVDDMGLNAIDSALERDENQIAESIRRYI